MPDLVRNSDQGKQGPDWWGSKVDKMLQDPVKGVLGPLVPEDASAVAVVAVTFRPSAGFGPDGWEGLTEVVAVSANQSLALGDVLASLPGLPAPVVADYDRAYAAMIGGDHAGAAGLFAATTLSNGPVAPSLYGLALALLELGSNEKAEELAGFVSELPGYGDPRAAALAGYAAFQNRHTKAARVYLAKAARIARLQPEFRSVQRFAQRVLLMQQFALGD